MNTGVRKAVLATSGWVTRDNAATRFDADLLPGTVVNQDGTYAGGITGFFDFSADVIGHHGAVVELQLAFGSVIFVFGGVALAVGNLFLDGIPGHLSARVQAGGGQDSHGKHPFQSFQGLGSPFGWEAYSPGLRPPSCPPAVGVVPFS